MENINGGKNEREIFFETILENIPSMVFIKDAKTLRFTLINKAGEELLGLSRKDLIGKNDYDFFPKEQADFFTAKDRDVLKEGKVLDIPLEPINTKNGLRWLHTKKIPIIFINGTAQYLLGISLDITDEKIAQDEVKRMNEELEKIIKKRTAALELTNAELQKEIIERRLIEKEVKDSEEKYRFLADSIPQIIWTALPDGRVDYFNQHGYQYCNVSFEDIKDWNWTSIVHPENVQKTLYLWNEIILSGLPGEFECRIKRFDGQFRWNLVKVRPMKNGLGRLIKWFGTATDIDDQKNSMDKLSKMKEELEFLNSNLVLSNKELSRSNSDLDTFVYAASHDLKTPVNHIEGLLKLLLERIKSNKEPDEEITELSEKLNTSVRRLNKTIKELSELGKIQKLDKNEIEEIQIENYLDEIKLDIQHYITESGAQIKSDTKQCSLIHFSRSGFRSILFNLLINAIKYRSHSRQLIIEIKSWIENGFTVLEIKDNGLGFSPAQKEKIFGIFQRFQTQVEGTGIGLYIVKRIIDNSGGKIEVESQEGTGTTFRIYFKN